MPNKEVYRDLRRPSLDRHAITVFLPVYSGIDSLFVILVLVLVRRCAILLVVLVPVCRCAILVLALVRRSAILILVLVRRCAVLVLALVRHCAILVLIFVRRCAILVLIRHRPRPSSSTTGIPGFRGVLYIESSASSQTVTRFGKAE